MQIHILKRLIMLIVLVVLTTVTARAQSGARMTVTVPFDFDVAGKTLPAGQYQVGPSGQITAEVLVLRATHGGAAAFINTRGIGTREAPRESKLIFRRYGNEYFLGEVWIAGTSSGRQVPSSRKERLVKQENARLGGSGEKVALRADKR